MRAEHLRPKQAAVRAVVVYERSGQVSLLSEPKIARIVEIRIEAGVQTVRIERD